MGGCPKNIFNSCAWFWNFFKHKCNFHEYVIQKYVPVTAHWQHTSQRSDSSFRPVNQSINPARQHSDSRTHQNSSLPICTLTHRSSIEETPAGVEVSCVGVRSDANVFVYRPRHLTLVMRFDVLKFRVLGSWEMIYMARESKMRKCDH